MPMRYAHEAAVYTALKFKDGDTASRERATSLENDLAAAFDGMIGRSFGTAPVPETRTIDGRDSTVLVLHDGIRTLTGIQIGGTWDGVTFVSPETVDPSDYALWALDQDGVAYGIQSYGWEWPESVRVTGIWADQAVATVPPDVRRALTLLTIKEYRRETSSPSDAVGPDGQVISTPSGWNDPLVKAAIDRYRLVRLVV